MFEISLSPRALKQLQSLDSKTKERVEKVISILSEDPVPSKLLDVKKLKGQISVYRIRVGDFRIIYDIKWMEREIGVAKIARRESAYE